MRLAQQVYYYIDSEEGPGCPDFGCVVAPSATEAIRIVSGAFLSKEWRAGKPELEDDGAFCVYRQGKRERKIQVGPATVDEERSEPDSAQIKIFAGLAYTRTGVTNMVYFVGAATPLQAMNAFLDFSQLTPRDEDDVSGERELPIPLLLSSASWQRALLPDDLEKPYAMVVRPKVLNCPDGFVIEHWHKTSL